MKNLFIALAVLGIVGLTSCSDDLDIPVESRQFTELEGFYEGELECIGESSDDEQGSTVYITIDKVNASQYTVEIQEVNENRADAFILNAVKMETELDIPNQLIVDREDPNSLEIEGSVTVGDDGRLVLEFDYSVDNEEVSTCSTILIKK